jgi:transposase
MANLSEQVDFVVGVDTHRDTHTAAVVDRTGATRAITTRLATAGGYQQLLVFGRQQAPQRRLWAVEGSGSFGRGLSTYLLDRHEAVIEIDRPKRPARRDGAKSDPLDAVRAAREALARPHRAWPRQRGDREAMRVLLRTRRSAMDARRRALCQLKALLITAPEPLRARLRDLATAELIGQCAQLRAAPRQSSEQQATRLALRALARPNALQAQLRVLVQAHGPHLLTEPGIGVITAAELLCAWSHPGRLRSDAAFAALAGVAPIPASSGRVIRYRLNRHGDRQLNCALHTIVLSRLSHHAETRRYAARRTAEGKTDREIRRCLTRHLARRLFKLLEGHSKRLEVPSRPLDGS